LRLGLVGLGKIARDQHLPAIATTLGVELAAVASWAGTAEGVPNYRELDEMLAAEPDLDAIILCQPPQARFAAARTAILAGKHVFLEKPPGVTVIEVETLIALARQHGVTLFASWHSRYGAAVAAAKRWLATREVHSVTITWKEDVRQWHPGQDWIWQPGGFGVFDPGINALSILTEIIPEPIRLIEAKLETPANRQAPIAARLAMATAGGAPITAEFDWRQTGPQSWDIVVAAAGGTLCLGHGGNTLAIDGIEQPTGPQPVAAEGEYPAMYRHFGALIAAGQSDVDLAPLQIVADSFLRGSLYATETFED
jgi:predicted dehydrogenase